MNIIKNFLNNIVIMVVFASISTGVQAYFASQQVDLIAEFTNTATIISLIFIAFFFSFYEWYKQ